MKIFHKLDEIPFTDEIYLSIGNYDGFHLGHKRITDELIKAAGHKKKCLITFKKAPLEFLEKEKFKGYIFPFGYKEKIFEEYGFDYFISLDFNEVKDIDKENFIKMLKEKFSKINIFIGYNFRFGKNNEGNIEFLKQKIENTFIIDKVSIDGKKISSSLIRELIAKGEIEKANIFLGREYFIDSEEIKGDGIGSKIGFPTINLKINEQVLPSYGVYFTIYKIEDKVFPAMTYIGKRPTFNGSELRNETNIINLDNESLKIIKKIKKHKIFFIKKTREEKKCHNLEELKNLLYNDREIILNLFKEYWRFKR